MKSRHISSNHNFAQCVILLHSRIKSMMLFFYFIRLSVINKQGTVFQEIDSYRSVISL